MNTIHQVKKALMAMTLFAGLTGAVSAASYDPVGPQNDVAISTVLDGGWSVIYAGGFDEGVELAPIWERAGDQIMLAARRMDLDTFDVLASISTALFLPLQTAENETIESNGASWYKNGLSLGFASSGSSVSQIPGDLGDLFETGYLDRDRLSWTTNFTFSGTGSVDDPADWLSFGFRSGDNIFLEDFDSTVWQRVILTTGVSPVSTIPLPAAGWLLLAGMGALAAAGARKKAVAA